MNLSVIAYPILTKRTDGGARESIGERVVEKANELRARSTDPTASSVTIEGDPPASAASAVAWQAHTQSTL